MVAVRLQLRIVAALGNRGSLNAEKASLAINGDEINPVPAIMVALEKLIGDVPHGVGMGKFPQGYRKSGLVRLTSNVVIDWGSNCCNHWLGVCGCLRKESIACHSGS